MRTLLSLSSMVIFLAGCDGCGEPGGVDADGNEASASEGDVNEGKGDATEDEGDVDEDGDANEGEGEGEGDANEGEGEGEGEGDANEGEGEAAAGDGEGEGEGEAAAGEGEGEAAAGGSGDVFVEIDYSFADAPERPAFRFSDTPGFGPDEWAYNDPLGSGLGAPDAWDRFNNMEVENDFRLGRVLVVGTGNHELQLMLGLPSTVSYQTVLVEVDGDEEAHSGVARYDVYNPLIMAGLFSDDAAVTDGIGRHTRVLDLGPCLVPGERVQAIRLDPQTGAVGLKRLRVTLVNARW